MWLGKSSGAEAAPADAAPGGGLHCLHGYGRISSAHLSLSQAACAGKAEVVVPADRPGKAGEEDPGHLETALPNCCYLLPDSRGYNDPVLSRDETVTA